MTLSKIQTMLLKQKKDTYKAIGQFSNMDSKSVPKKEPKVDRKIANEEFLALLSGVKNFKVDENKEMVFEKAPELPKPEKIEEIARVPFRLITKEETKPKKKKSKLPIKLQDIDGLTNVLLDLEKRISKALQYNIYSSGGISAVVHDASLSGQGNIQSPLSVVPASTSTSVFGEVAAGSGTSFSLAHTPIGTISLSGNGPDLLPGTDYSIAGAVITLLGGLSFPAGGVLASYKY